LTLKYCIRAQRVGWIRWEYLKLTDNCIAPL
jgi:hypothetical protein